MGKILTVILALLAPTFALAEPFEDQHGNWWDMPMPPAYYFDKPLLGKPVIRPLPEADIVRICSGAAGKYENFGCTFPYKECIIHVSIDLPPKLRKAVERHELAHCHGWGADHPEE